MRCYALLLEAGDGGTFALVTRMKSRTTRQAALLATGSAAGDRGRECEAYAMKVRETLNFNSDEEAAMVEEIFNNAMGCLGGADRELEVGQPHSACLFGAAARVTRACSGIEQAGSSELPARAEAKSTRVRSSLQALPGCGLCRGVRM